MANWKGTILPPAKPAVRKFATARGADAPQPRLRPAGIPTVSPMRESVQTLGIPAPDTPPLIRRVREGFPFATVERLQHAFALSTDAIVARVQIPIRTLTRGRASARLKADGSDRVLRADRLMHQAAALFNNDAAAAKTGMTAPWRGLGGAVPPYLAGTEIGAREVEDALGRGQDGVFA